MNLNLDVNEVNLVLEALGEMPAKKSYQLLTKVLVQVNAQQQGGQPVGSLPAQDPEPVNPKV